MLHVYTVGWWYDDDDDDDENRNGSVKEGRQRQRGG
jgi:hypothetical protein